MENLNMPASQTNGDSGSEAGLSKEQQDITLIDLEDYNITDKDMLLERIYNDKNGKSNTKSALGMYIEIPTSYPIDLQAFSSYFLQELSQGVNLFSAQRWSENFGRVFVGISDKSPDEKVPCELISAENPESLKYRQVSSGRTISPTQLVETNSLQGGSNLVLLNSAFTSIEGLLINVTHMLDELIWNLALSDGKRTANSYSQAVRYVRDTGISFEFANEEEILSKYISDTYNNKVRLYGSRKSKTVPFVLGCVVPNALPKTKSLNQLDAYSQNEAPKSVEVKEVNSYEVTIGITTAKEIHAGHLLLFLTANSFAKCIDATVIVSANNTGPRVNATITSLQKEVESLLGRDITLEQANQILSSLPLSVTQRLYQMRNEDFVPSINSDFSTLKFATEQNMVLLRLLGLNVNYILDTDCNPIGAINYAFSNTPGYFPELGLGFTSLRGGQSANYLDNGEFTAVGASLANMINLAINDDGLKGIAYFDHESSTAIASKVITEQLGIPVYQPSGAAIGFGGEIASGTKGNSIRLKEIYDFITRYGQQLGIDSSEIMNLGMNALTFSLFSNYYISDLHPNNYSANTFYDFASKEYFFEFFKSQIGSYRQVQNNIQNVLNTLERDETVNRDDSSAKRLYALVARSEAITRMTPEKLLQVISSQTVLKKDKVNVQMFIDMGYSEQESLRKIEDVEANNLFICKRSHPYFEYINFLLTMDIQDLMSLTGEQKNSIKKAILTVKKLFS
ncbi:hypothetical protein KC678_01785 [Candidatus Dojkabacteria bacterium]|uniref:Uncharacterized protein n=1 Tax=Candidatus Dojkabacteria bacterium TaxID=2099670 RepID=A0A955IAD8_9BACT|nr:hypothetical protein [Candidatus Dojkabacteria bacterium]